MTLASRTAALLAASVLAAGCAPGVPGGSAPAPAAESRIYDSGAARYVSLATLASAAAEMDVVFVGEQHDDPATHRAELALLAAIGARNPNVVLSLEMFERDVQPVLDAYLAGQLPESAFVAESRPWPRYTTDYRALVELARAHGWPVVASNVPRRIASMVSRGGLDALDTLALGERAFAARVLSCPRDRYYELFAESMRGHSAGGGGAPVGDAEAMTNRFYEAQCVKDETMGEAIAAAHAKAGRDAVVVHVNGAFHSNMGLGAAERALRRIPGARGLVITAVPVDDLATANASGYADRAAYVILTPKPPVQPKP
ncbi:MAG: ChaN family lipoprotein [Gemmatimonadaceae bacterium]